jgi:Reverse transcriptase (RNA-dependent DNA polymerase)
MSIQGSPRSSRYALLVFKLSEAAVDSALNHLESFGDTDIFPPAFEIAAIRHGWGPVKEWILKQDLDSWQQRTGRRCLAPKGRYGFRVVTQLDPIEAIIWTALAIEIGEAVEGKRPSPRALVVHSHRFDPQLTNRHIFKRGYSFASFRKACLSLASSVDYSHVVVTDIADFFPRLYLHPLENALASTGRTDVGRVISKLVKTSNLFASYGLPIGLNAARFFSEAAIMDVDQWLASEGIRYCRYSDDFAFFARSEHEAIDILNRFARALYEMHGLTLQERKTSILTVGGYRKRYSRSDEDRVNDVRWERISEAVAIDDYGSLIDLTDEELAALEELNLIELLAEQEVADVPDLSLCRLLLTLIASARLRDENGVAIRLWRRAPSLTPNVIQAVARQNFDDEFISDAGDELLRFAEPTDLGYSEFIRCWALSNIPLAGDWVPIPKLTKIYADCSDSWTRREVILNLAHRKETAWFRARKHEFVGMNPWERRAFLIGATRLAGEESKFFLKGVRSSFDVLDTAVTGWAQAGGFSSWVPQSS